jgi:spore coat polysaccharide biosynthesis predicted glycosyltransferase SpsG
MNLRAGIHFFGDRAGVETKRACDGPHLFNFIDFFHSASSLYRAIRELFFGRAGFRGYRPGRVKRVLFRCDGNAQTGLGHVARCLDIARLLGEAVPDLEFVFAGDYSAPARELLDHSGVVLEPVDSRAPLAHLRAQAGTQAGATPNLDGLIVDSYRVGEGDLSEWTSHGHKVALVDDFGQVEALRARLVMNFRVGAEELFSYRSTFRALGSGYFPANRALEGARDEQARRGILGPIRRVLLFIGGTDHDHAGEVLGRAASQAYPAAEILWVQTNETLFPLPANVTQLPMQPSLAPLLGGVDLVLAGGGRLKYEAAYAGVPCASASQNEGQAEDTRELVRRGLCLDLGPTSDLDPERVAAALSGAKSLEVRTALRQRTVEWFPRESGQRLVRILRESLAL